MIDVHLTVIEYPIVSIDVKASDEIVTEIKEESTVVLSSELSFSQLAKYVSFEQHNGLVSKNVQDAISEISDNLFQQGEEPTVGVNEGDLWYDTINDTLMVYSTIDGSSSWAEVVMQNQGTVDGGEF